eukprot:285738-Rhodomonas_salina.3
MTGRLVPLRSSSRCVCARECRGSERGRRRRMVGCAAPSALSAQATLRCTLRPASLCSAACVPASTRSLVGTHHARRQAFQGTPPISAAAPTQRRLASLA